jgi:hypothetical protein
VTPAGQTKAAWPRAPSPRRRTSTRTNVHAHARNLRARLYARTHGDSFAPGHWRLLNHGDGVRTPPLSFTCAVVPIAPRLACSDGYQIGWVSSPLDRPRSLGAQVDTCSGMLQRVLWVDRVGWWRTSCATPLSVSPSASAGSSCLHVALNRSQGWPATRVGCNGRKLQGGST